MSWEKVEDYCGGCGCEDCQAIAGVGIFHTECGFCGKQALNGNGLLNKG